MPRITLPQTVLLLTALASVARAHSPIPSDSTWPLTPSPEKKALLQSYARYVRTVQDKGALGLSALTLPGFELRSGGQRWRGRDALLKLDRYDHGVSRFSVTLQHLRVGREAASVVVQEHLVFPMPPHVPGMLFGNTVTTLWLEGWRKTAGGWKLATFGPVPKTLRNDTGGTSYTLAPR